MRPKKVILLVDSDETELSVRRTVLWSGGVYAVLTAATAEEALARVVEMDGMLAAALIVTRKARQRRPPREALDGEALTREIKQRLPYLPVVLLDRGRETRDESTAADAFLPHPLCNMRDLLDVLRIRTAQKRGPKPQRKPVAGVAPAAGLEVRVG
jgi:two-component system, OmpR family, response regulator CpxR